MKIIKILLIILFYVICIFIVGYIGGVINSTVLYAPTVYELQKFDPKFGNLAGAIATEKFYLGTIIGGFLGIPLVIFIRILSSRFSKK